MSTEEKNLGGRPRFFDDQKKVRQLEEVMRILPTAREASSVVGCSLATLERYCAHRYPGEGFEGLKKEFGDPALVSLRRAMFKNAYKGNTTMQIFLAKNLLGMNDGAQVTIPDVQIKLAYKDE